MSMKLTFDTTGTIVGKEYTKARKEEVEFNGRKYGPAPERFTLYVLIGTKSKQCNLFVAEPRVVSVRTDKATYLSVMEQADVACQAVQNGTRYYITAMDGYTLVGVEELTEENEFGVFDDD